MAKSSLGNICAQPSLKWSAGRTPCQLRGGRGGAHRRFPTGGSAYGIPLNTFMVASSLPATPLTSPLSVRTEPFNCAKQGIPNSTATNAHQRCFTATPCVSCVFEKSRQVRFAPDAGRHADSRHPSRILLSVTSLHRIECVRPAFRRPWRAPAFQRMRHHSTKRVAPTGLRRSVW